MTCTAGSSKTRKASLWERSIPIPATRVTARFNMGWASAAQYWRKGYATEAIQIVLRYFFDELRYQKVNVHIYDFNSGSIELHRRLGFQEEGRLRRMGYTQGQHYDWLLLGMTREEFAAVHA
jgi:RimJ/RimL family protein N-acetyltransferase